MRVTDRHDMTLAVQVALNPNTTNQRKNQTLFGEELTHSHTMTPFEAPGKHAIWKHCGKRRNCS